MIKKIINDLKNSLSAIPTISRRNAENITFFLLQNRDLLSKIGENCLSALTKIKNCKQCSNFTEEELCKICKSRASSKTICIVANIKDLINIEKSDLNCKYHILKNKIDPLAGVNEDVIDLDKILNRIQKENISEIILALDPDMEGNLTSEYLKSSIKNVKITKLAVGIAPGSKIEYADKDALQNSIKNREEM